MTEIRLDREYYHLHVKIGKWCEQHFGPVDFYNKGNNRWSREMRFGYQDFMFHRDADASFFALHWVK